MRSFPICGNRRTTPAAGSRFPGVPTGRQCRKRQGFNRWFNHLSSPFHAIPTSHCPPVGSSSARPGSLWNWLDICHATGNRNISGAGLQQVVQPPVLPFPRDPDIPLPPSWILLGPPRLTVEQAGHLPWDRQSECLGGQGFNRWFNHLSSLFHAIPTSHCPPVGSSSSRPGSLWNRLDICHATGNRNVSGGRASTGGSTTCPPPSTRSRHPIDHQHGPSRSATVCCPPGWTSPAQARPRSRRLSLRQAFTRALRHSAQRQAQPPTPGSNGRMRGSQLRSSTKS
jgi:hypothetical protein